MCYIFNHWESQPNSFKIWFTANFASINISKMLELEDAPESSTFAENNRPSEYD